MENEIKELYLYQSDIYYIEKEGDNCISIYTNNGETIRIKGEFNITVTINED